MNYRSYERVLNGLLQLRDRCLRGAIKQTLEKVELRIALLQSARARHENRAFEKTYWPDVSDLDLYIVCLADQLQVGGISARRAAKFAETFRSGVIVAKGGAA